MCSDDRVNWRGAATNSRWVAPTPRAPLGPREAGLLRKSRGTSHALELDDRSRCRRVKAFRSEWRVGSDDDE